ncbi:MAG: hypothetical protein GY773_01265, partial [Actinomycetia bacterium]|nr:hypothetical protein [Actinomycetes bacterium]
MRSNRGKRRDDAGPASPRRHRLVQLLALLAALMLLAAACGGNDSDDAGDDDTTAEDTAFATEETESEDLAGGGVDDDATERGFDAAAPETTVAASDDEEPADASDVDGDAATDEEGDGGDRLGAGGATVTPTAADIGRKLSFTAHVHVEVDDVAAASAEATSIVQGMGGFVFGQHTSGGPEPSSELIFKILPE